MKKSCLLIVVALPALFACSAYSAQDDDTGQEHLMVSALESTKLGLSSERQTVLNNGDRFSVFFKTDKNELWTYDGPDNAVSGDLKHQRTEIRIETTDLITAIFPYHSSASIANGVVRTSLPSIQYYTPGSFGDDAALMVSQCPEAPLSFQYFTGFVRLVLSEGGLPVDRVDFKGNAGEMIAGDCSVDFSKRSLTHCTSSHITLQTRDNSPISTESGCEFLFSVAPQLFRAGYTFTIHYANGMTQEIGTTQPMTVSAGTITSPLTVTPLKGSCIPAVFYTDGTNVCNPFTSTLDLNLLPSTGGLSSAVFLASDPSRQYPFYFFVQDASSRYNLRITAGGGLNVGGTPGDYILLPAVPKRRLAKLRVTSNNIWDYMVLTDENGQSVCDELKLAPFCVGELAPREGTEACRLEFTTALVNKISVLELYYE